MIDDLDIEEALVRLAGAGAITPVEPWDTCRLEAVDAIETREFGPCWKCRFDRRPPFGWVLSLPGGGAVEVLDTGGGGWSSGGWAILSRGNETLEPGMVLRGRRGTRRLEYRD